MSSFFRFFLKKKSFNVSFLKRVKSNFIVYENYVQIINDNFQRMLNYINIQNFKFIQMLKKRKQYVNVQKFENKNFIN